ncbi:MAG: DPP IV N-terminal domain-containing protein [Saprospiraceae bacterium]
MKYLSTLFISLLVLTTGFGQKNISMSDAILKGRTLSPESLSGVQWVPGTHTFTYRAENKLVRMEAGNQAIDTIDLLSQLNAAAQAAGMDAFSGLPGFQWKAADEMWFQKGSTIYEYKLGKDLKAVNAMPEGTAGADVHEKNYNAAYSVDDELRVCINGKESVVAKSEKDGIVYGKSVHREEFGIYKGTFWSPSGRYLAFYRMDESMVTEYPIYVLDEMPAKAEMIRYPYSGAKSHHVTLGIYDTQTGTTSYLNTGEPVEQYLTNIAWTPDDKQVLIAVLNREQNHMWLNAYDVASGNLAKTLFEEKNDKWVEPQHPAIFVPGSDSEFIWESERDGFNHLYLYNLSGKMIRQLSEGPNPVTQNYGFTKDGSRCFYQMATNYGMDRDLYMVGLDKKAKPVKLSQEKGTHFASVSEDGRYLVDYFSNEKTPRTIFLADTEKPSRPKIIFSASNPLEEYAVGMTKMLQLKAEDGTVLNARMILPTNFDGSKKYPAIVYVYNGPHVQLVSNTWMGAGALWMHHMAEEGYVLFTIDGRGSANRGQAFENAIHRQLGDLEVADQLVGVNYLKHQSFVDADRIGVFGWSYGGFMTTSLMTRPEAKGAFKCGVAGGPVIDWRMYEIMYTERYMDSPEENPEGYEKNSLFNYIDNLDGRLLMIHGSSDNVVLWQHSLRYIRECVRKGKQIDYFVYPEHLHNVRGKDRVHLFEKIEQFFADNL